MSLLELFLIAVGLSMDAFAVSVGKGLSLKRIDYKLMLVLAISFGAFQALMPVLGWLAAAQFSQAFESIGHWVAFALLALIGSKMIYDNLKGAEEDEEEGEGLSGIVELLALSVATSIDALAVGVSFAAVGEAIMPAVAIIGATTFVLSAAGVAIGCKFGHRHERAAGIAGGAILILIGVKIVVEALI